MNIYEELQKLEKALHAVHFDVSRNIVGSYTLTEVNKSLTILSDLMTKVAQEKLKRQASFSAFTPFRGSSFSIMLDKSNDTPPTTTASKLKTWIHLLQTHTVPEALEVYNSMYNNNKEQT